MLFLSLWKLCIINLNNQGIAERVETSFSLPHPIPVLEPKQRPILGYASVVRLFLLTFLHV